MKISNVTILNTNLTNNTAKISFTISEATENVNIYLKINDEEYKKIFSNKTNEDLEYITNISRGINNLLLKATDSTTEYITEPIQVLLKEAPTIENLECSYSDSTGKYILNFAFNGDTNFKYNIYLKLDADDYIEVLSNQISGDKTIEQTSTMGNHTCILKVSDGYDEYTFSSYQFEITNRKPILSKVLVTDITNNGEAYIYYSTKDIESSTLTHKLTIGTTETVISPTQVDNFYSYRITGLSEGISNCTISISDGIDVISSDIFSIEVFSDTTDKKELLRRAKVRYDSAYQQLRDIIVSVISDLKYDYDIENALIAKAQDNYKIEYSNFNKISQQSIDTIGSNKVKVTKQELQSEINDVDSAVNSLETTMWGVFQDGILDQSERDTLSGSLDLVAKEKIDIDKDYEALYNNEDLLDPSKTKLQTNYNNFIEAHNSLVTTINNIINKEGIIDNTDKSNMDTAFENWRTALGNYRTASLEAIDSIAKKKADDSADVVDKKWAEIVLDPETGIKSQVGSLQSKITGAGGIEERLKTAEQTITTEGISNIVKDVYYTKTEVDNKLDDIDIGLVVESIDVMYYLSNSTTELSGGSWSTTAPTLQNGKYIWSKTVTTFTDDTTRETEPVCITGGKDGQSLYTWIKYSDNKDGSNMYDTPTDNTLYIGIATNKESETESSNPSDYTWSKFKGVDGNSYYTWIRYADDEKGSGISDDPTNKNYIGFAYNKTTSTESNNPSDYIWSLIKGKDGVDGTSVKILGTYESESELNAAHPSDNEIGDGYIIQNDLYVWTGTIFENVGQIKGEDGKDGVDGVTLYTWIKYSDNEDGSDMYDIPTDKTKYIGIATNKITQTESNIVSDYKWSKFRGDDGVDGTDGKGILTVVDYYKVHSSDIGVTNATSGFSTDVPQMDATNKYLWSYELITYTDNSTTKTNARVIGVYGENGTDGKGISSIVEYYAVNNSSETVPTSFGTTIPTINAMNRFLWNYEVIKFTDGSEKTTDKRIIGVYGETGEAGRGISSIVEQYYLSSSKTSQTDGSWVDSPPTWVEGKYMWTRSKITYSDNSIEYTTPICDNTWENISDLQNQVNNNKTEIETTKTTVASHTTSLNSITSRVETNESNITTVDGKVTNMENRVSSAEQKITDKAITSVVQESQFIKDMNGKISTNKSNISKVEQTVDSWEVEIGNKADSSNIISIINASTEGITISSSKVNISGFVTFSDLRNPNSYTTIHGSNIATKTISASDISTGTLTGCLLQTYSDSTTKGVRIAKESMQLNNAAFFYKTDGNFNIQCKEGVNISSMEDIYIMPGLNASGTVTGNYDVVIPGCTTRLQKLYVINESNFTGDVTFNTNIKLNGGLNCPGDIAVGGNMSVDGTAWISTLSVIKSSTLKGVSCTSMSNTGNMTVDGTAWISTLNVTNSSTLKGVSCTSITATGTVKTTGALQGGGISTGGNMSVDGTAWIATLYVNGNYVTSDETLKTDIKYVNMDTQELTEDGLMSPNVNITTSDMHQFIETLPMVSYRLTEDVEKGEDNTYYGFLAQEILYTKVGSELIKTPNDKEKELIGDKLRYSENKFIAFICGALQEEIKQRKALERQLNDLINTINK